MNLTKAINTIRYISSIPKSLYFNLRVLPFSQAIKLPILVSNKTKFASLEGKIILSKIRTGIVRIGFGSTQTLDYTYNRTIINLLGTINILGKCKIGQGSRIEVAKDGELTLGDNFFVSGQSKIICHYKVNIGDNALLAWDSLVMDTDFHDIYDKDGTLINQNKPITIGKKVWLGTRTTILKGSHIPDGCIVAANSLISKEYTTQNCILGGNPAKCIREDISW